LATTALEPLHALIEAHVLGAERLHGDDTTVPILAKGKTVTGRIWTCAPSGEVERRLPGRDQINIAPVRRPESALIFEAGAFERKTGTTFANAPVFAMTDRLAELRRRPRFITLRVIANRSIPRAICKASPVFCRLTLFRVTTRFTILSEPRVRSSRRYAGRMPGASFSNSPTLPPMRGVAKKLQQSRRSRSKR
jgi:hypothetical protein